MLSRIGVATAVVSLSVLGLAPASGQENAERDPFFPDIGDSRYDVADYDIAIRYARATRNIRATATITATSTQELDAFGLDFEGLRVTGVQVNGATAEFRRSGTRLLVTTPSALAANEEFTTRVSYRGRPGTHTDPDGSKEGWFATPDGAFAVGEPIGTQTWVPVNNTLLDKASWSFHLNVPRPLHAVANGTLVSSKRSGGRRTWVWRAEQPMVPYLAMVQIGRGKVTRSTSAGIPTWTAISPRADRKKSREIRKLPKIIRFLADLWGPYPFDSAGSVIDPSNIGYALETQTRPIYSTPPDLATVVHETAHQWFGNSVTPSQWKDIWLNEGFAAWNEWYWAEKHGGPSAAKTMRGYRNSDDERVFSPPPGRPGSAKTLFANSIYIRGGMTLQALREKIGTGQFLGLLRQWVQQHSYGNASTSDFIDLAESVSGRQLDDFFQRWLFKSGKP